MRPISWLHISDFHFETGNEWSQDVVLDAMCRHIEQNRELGTAPDFIMITGDIAYSGRREEYTLAEKFVNRVELAAAVPRIRIFCVPGNHDIDRRRQTLCFSGARQGLTGPNEVDSLLDGGEDLSTLLAREENYRSFQNSTFPDQERVTTADGLGYVSHLAIEEVRLAIMGLDSAWLAEGGNSDNGQLLIGERQVLNAIQLVSANQDPPHIILGMAHHPFHWLRDFDLQSIQDRLEGILHFFHCGHLHQPHTRLAAPSDHGCLTVSAGAAFESRQYHNAYSVVSLDLSLGVRRVKVMRYDPTSISFTEYETREWPIDVAPIATCPIDELVAALRGRYPQLTGIADYLAALILDKKDEFLISAAGSHTFGPFKMMHLADEEFRSITAEFMRFRNVLRILYGRDSLQAIFESYGRLIESYGETLVDKCGANPDLSRRLEDYNGDVRTGQVAEVQSPFSHTVKLLDKLAEEGDWPLLRKVAQKHLNSSYLPLAVSAKRMFAFSLAYSDIEADKREAIEQYKCLTASDSVNASDIGALAFLVYSAGRVEEAVDYLLDGIKRFPEKATHFAEFGHRIVEATGNVELRTQIEDALRDWS